MKQIQIILMPALLMLGDRGKIIAFITFPFP